MVNIPAVERISLITKCKTMFVQLVAVAKKTIIAQVMKKLTSAAGSSKISKEQNIPLAGAVNSLVVLVNIIQSSVLLTTFSTILEFFTLMAQLSTKQY